MTKYFEMIEFKFWNTLVQVLSENAFVRAAIRNTYQFFHNPEKIPNRVLVGLISIAGLFFGISMSILITFLA
jgi:hypothetical protein